MLCAYTIVKSSKQSMVIMGKKLHMRKFIFFLESLGVSKGAQPIHNLMRNDTKRKSECGLGIRISNVIKIYYNFLFQRKGVVYKQQLRVVYFIPLDVS